MLNAHPAVFAPMAERIDYAMVVGTLAAANGEIDPAEIEGLRELCRDIALPPRQADQVVTFAQAPEHDALQAALGRLRHSELRFALVRDMVALGFSDGRYDVQERRQVRGLSAMMLVGEDDVRRIEDEVVATLHGQADAVHEPAPPPSLATRMGFGGVQRMYRKMLGTLVDD